MSDHKGISEVIFEKMQVNNLKISQERSKHFYTKNIVSVFGDIVVCNADESHIREVAELWANLASIQQISAPAKYNFSLEVKNWQKFVKDKISKKDNLLLVAHREGDPEIRGFLYLQTIKAPPLEIILKTAIEDLYIKPQYRRQEIATKLLNVAITCLEKNSILQLDLISVTGANDLLAFYKKYLGSINTSVAIDIITI